MRIMKGLCAAVLVLGVVGCERPADHITGTVAMSAAKATPTGSIGINVDSVADSQKMLGGWGLVQRELPRNEIVDHQFVEYAVQQLGPYQG